MTELWRRGARLAHPAHAWTGRTCLVLACWALLATAACDEEREPLADWSEGYDNAGMPGSGTGGLASGGAGGSGGTVAVDVPADSFALTIPSSAMHPLRLYEREGGGDCAVKQGRRNGQADIVCMLDINELDLWVLGLALDVTAPAGMCDFVKIEDYLFESFPIGVGPAVVSYTIGDDGTIEDELNTFGGKPACDFDYSRIDPRFPNCCTGAYTEQVTLKRTGQVTSRTGSWQGGSRLGDCYGGAGYLNQSSQLTIEGFPKDLIYFVGRDAFATTVTYGGPSAEYERFDTGTNDDLRDNRLLANYIEEADHDGLPTALRDRKARPYYTFLCLDHAEEKTARIRLMVREWNLEAEFERGEAGDPDTPGLEPYWDTRRNDMLDWGDFAGDPDDYPRIFRVR